MNKPYQFLPRHAASVLFAALTALAGLTAPGYAQQQSTNAFLQGYVDWLKQPPKGGGEFPPKPIVTFTLVSDTIGGDGPATYVEGQLKLTGTKAVPTLSGTGTRYFSNKRWTPPNSFFAGPFDPKQTDTPTLTIDVATGKATLIGGNVTAKINLQNKNWLLHGPQSNGLFQVWYVIGLGKKWSS